MARAATLFGRGLAVGAGAALLYSAARQANRGEQEDGRAGVEPSSSRLIDWGWSSVVARQTAGRTQPLQRATRDRLQGEYETFLREIEAPIATYTGNQLSLQQTTVEVLDRPGWIAANIRNFREILEPLDGLLDSAALGGLLRPGQTAQLAGRLVLSTEIGLLLGYLARRVLGQYDVSLLPEASLAGGRLYFVHPNLQQAERKLDVPAQEFRRWVALHEATHAHEFELHPWLRDYMNSTVRRYLELVVEDLADHGHGRSLAGIVERLVSNLRRGHDVIAALMTPEQRQLASRLQALMSLAEGYSNHVMNAVGRTMLPHFEEIHDRVERRQQRRAPVESAFLRVTGLSLKMEQYRRGEQFVDAVVRDRGVEFANRAWTGPVHLPTEAEIANPRQWVTRMEAAVA